MKNVLLQFFLIVLIIFLVPMYAQGQGKTFEVSFEVTDNPVATSTATTTSPPTPPGGGPLPVPPQPIFTNIAVEANTDSSEILWSTNPHTRGIIMWGATPDLELGSISAPLYNREHTTFIESLIEQKTYYFRIIAQDGFGNMVDSGIVSFITKGKDDVQSPSNPITFTAKVEGAAIRLDWQNPLDEDFRSVRIIRSPLFYPADTVDGALVYEGSLETFLDTEVEKDIRYYYTLFARDAAGNYSSGVVADAIIFTDGGSEEIEPPFENLPDAPFVHPQIDALTLYDLEYIQKGILLPVSSTSPRIYIDGGYDLLVRLEYEKVPEVLKTIAITLTDPIEKDKHFSFLLRVNKDKSYYEARLSPLKRTGVYEFLFAVLDYKNQNLKKLYGQFIVDKVSALVTVLRTPVVITYARTTLMSFLLLFMIFIIACLRRRQQYLEDESQPCNRC